jgi:hypothetical protein
MPHYVLDVRGSFEKELLATIIPRDAYRSGNFTNITLSVRTDYPILWDWSPFIKYVFYNNENVYSLKELVIEFDIVPKEEHILFEVINAANTIFKDNNLPNISLTEFRPFVLLEDILLSDPPPKRGITDGLPYWIMFGSIDYKYTTDNYFHDNWQKIAYKIASDSDALALQLSAPDNEFGYKKLKEVLGLYNLPMHKYIWGFAHSRGVISSKTLPTHLAAALSKYCVFVCSGRHKKDLISYSKEVLEDNILKLDSRYEDVNKTIVAHKVIDNECPDGKVGCGFESVIDKKSLCKCSERVNDFLLSKCMSKIPYRKIFDAVFECETNM